VNYIELGFTPRADDLEQLAALVDDGRLRPTIQEMPLAAAGIAHRLSESGHTRGKLLLAIE
jgi:NADPH:quinone reductase-like Zn-dependent oxidoreductase